MQNQFSLSKTTTSSMEYGAIRAGCLGRLFLILVVGIILFTLSFGTILERFGNKKLPEAWDVSIGRAWPGLTGTRIRDVDIKGPFLYRAGARRIEMSYPWPGKGLVGWQTTVERFEADGGWIDGVPFEFDALKSSTGSSGEGGKRGLSQAPQWMQALPLRTFLGNLSLLDSRISFAGSQPDIHFNLRVEQLDSRIWPPVSGPVQFDGWIPGELSLPWKGKPFQISDLMLNVDAPKGRETESNEIPLSGRLTAHKLDWGDFTFSAVSARFRGTTDILSLEPLQAYWLGSEARAGMVITHLFQPGKRGWRIRANMESFEIGQLIRQLGLDSSIQISGTWEAWLEIGGEGSKISVLDLNANQIPGSHGWVQVKSLDALSARIGEATVAKMKPVLENLEDYDVTEGSMTAGIEVGKPYLTVKLDGPKGGTNLTFQFPKNDEN